MSSDSWQLRCAELKQRGAFLYQSKLWSDCTFKLDDDVIVKAHKLIMAMASPVFSKMLYGSFVKFPVPIYDVRPEVFDVLLEYIYSDNLNIQCSKDACDLYYAAKKWRLPYVAKCCVKYLNDHMSPENVCHIYKVACESGDGTLQMTCEKIFSTRTKEVLKDKSFYDIDLYIIKKLFSLELLNIDNELDLFEALVKYAHIQEQTTKKRNVLRGTDEGTISPANRASPPKRPRLDSEDVMEVEQTPNDDSNDDASPSNASDCSLDSTSAAQQRSPTREVKGIKDKRKYRELVTLIRFLTLTPQEFAECSSMHTLLTTSEILALSMNIASKETTFAMPEGLNTSMVPRTQATKEDRTRLAAVYRSIIHNIKNLQRYESLPFYLRNLAWTLMVMSHTDNEDMLVLGVTCFFETGPPEWVKNTKVKVKFSTHKPVPKYMHKISFRVSEPTPEYGAWVTQVKRKDLLNPDYGFVDDFNTVTYKLYINTVPRPNESPDAEELSNSNFVSIADPEPLNIVLRVSKTSNTSTVVTNTFQNSRPICSTTTSQIRSSPNANTQSRTQLSSNVPIQPQTRSSPIVSGPTLTQPSAAVTVQSQTTPSTVVTTQPLTRSCPIVTSSQLKPSVNVTTNSQTRSFTPLTVQSQMRRSPIITTQSQSRPTVTVTTSSQTRSSTPATIQSQTRPSPVVTTQSQSRPTTTVTTSFQTGSSTPATFQSQTRPSPVVTTQSQSRPTTTVTTSSQTRSSTPATFQSQTRPSPVVTTQSQSRPTTTVTTSSQTRSSTPATIQSQTRPSPVVTTQSQSQPTTTVTTSFQTGSSTPATFQSQTRPSPVVTTQSQSRPTNTVTTSSQTRSSTPATIQSQTRPSPVVTTQSQSQPTATVTTSSQTGSSTPATIQSKTRPSPVVTTQSQSRPTATVTTHSLTIQSQTRTSAPVTLQSQTRLSPSVTNQSQPRPSLIPTTQFQPSATVTMHSQTRPSTPVITRPPAPAISQSQTRPSAPPIPQSESRPYPNVINQSQTRPSGLAIPQSQSRPSPNLAHSHSRPSPVGITRSPLLPSPNMTMQSHMIRPQAQTSPTLSSTSHSLLPPSSFCQLDESHTGAVAQLTQLGVSMDTISRLWKSGLTSSSLLLLSKSGLTSQAIARLSEIPESLSRYCRLPLSPAEVARLNDCRLSRSVITRLCQSELSNRELTVRLSQIGIPRDKILRLLSCFRGKSHKIRSTGVEINRSVSPNPAVLSTATSSQRSLVEPYKSTSKPSPHTTPSTQSRIAQSPTVITPGPCMVKTPTISVVQSTVSSIPPGLSSPQITPSSQSCLAEFAGAQMSPSLPLLPSKPCFAEALSVNIPRPSETSAVAADVPLSNTCPKPTWTSSSMPSCSITVDPLPIGSIDEELRYLAQDTITVSHPELQMMFSKQTSNPLHAVALPWPTKQTCNLTDVASSSCLSPKEFRTPSETEIVKQTPYMSSNADQATAELVKIIPAAPSKFSLEENKDIQNQISVPLKETDSECDEMILDDQIKQTESLENNSSVFQSKSLQTIVIEEIGALVQKGFFSKTHKTATKGINKKPNLKKSSLFLPKPLKEIALSKIKKIIQKKDSAVSTRSSHIQNIAVNDEKSELESASILQPKPLKDATLSALNAVLQNNNLKNRDNNISDVSSSKAQELLKKEITLDDSKNQENISPVFPIKKSGGVHFIDNSSMSDTTKYSILENKPKSVESMELISEPRTLSAIALSALEHFHETSKITHRALNYTVGLERMPYISKHETYPQSLKEITFSVLSHLFKF